MESILHTFAMDRALRPRKCFFLYTKQHEVYILIHWCSRIRANQVDERKETMRKRLTVLWLTSMFKETAISFQVYRFLCAREREKKSELFWELVFVFSSLCIEIYTFMNSNCLYNAMVENTHHNYNDTAINVSQKSSFGKLHNWFINLICKKNCFFFFTLLVPDTNNELEHTTFPIRKLFFFR